MIWSHYLLAIFSNANYFVSVFLHCNITNGSLLLFSIEFTTLINSSSRSIGDCVLERPILVGNKRCTRCAPPTPSPYRFGQLKSICIQPRPRFNSTKRSNCSSNDEMNLTAGSTERFLRPRARSIELKRARASRCAMKSDKSQWPCKTLRPWNPADSRETKHVS